MTVKVKIYSERKYNPTAFKTAEIEYTITDWTVKVLTAEEVSAMGFGRTSGTDEYLILTLESGEKAIFLNSYVDMFRI
ncbi:MAG: hypothetical protein IKU47_03265 [Oscillospiraceae bacterium]|nr:hypothetical protein [Oscillospiraceae bacterium]